MAQINPSSALRHLSVYNNAESWSDYGISHNITRDSGPPPDYFTSMRNSDGSKRGYYSAAIIFGLLVVSTFLASWIARRVMQYCRGRDSAYDDSPSDGKTVAEDMEEDDLELSEEHRESWVGATTTTTAGSTVFVTDSTNHEATR